MKGSFSEEALEQFARLAAEKQGVDFSEGETYDFARCVRADGSFYGTRGKCRKGTEAGDKEPEAPKTAGGDAESPSGGKPKKLKTDFRKEVEASAIKRRARDAKIGELQTEIANRKKAWQESEAQVREAKKGWVEAKAMTPAQRKTPEGQKKLQEAGRSLDKAERAAQKASDRMFAASKQLRRMTMTPEQRKEEREWNRTKKMYG